MTNRKIPFKQRLKYWFDNLMTGSIVPLIIMVVLLAILVTFITTVIIVIANIGEGDKPFESFAEAFWQSLMHVIDQGTITGEGGWAFRNVMLFLTFCGILFISTLVGLITSNIQNILADLRKGRSLVLEKDHIVILGWSSKIFPIIQELIKANENQDRACIAILADRDKIEMEDEIFQKVKRRRNVKIICRTGNPIDLDDLDIINPHEAKSIIIVSPDEHHSDAQNIKCILAITNHPNRKPDLYHVVAEIQTDYNEDIANIIGGDELTLIISSEVIARMAVQTCLQSGLSSVYNFLLDFSNADIYIREVPSLYGRTFRESLTAYEDICMLGIQRVNGIMLLNPRPGTKIKEGDKMILIDHDDDELPNPNFDEKSIQEESIDIQQANLEQAPRNILILGWNAQGATIVRELNNYVLEGSKVLVVAEDTEKIREEIEAYLPLDNLQYILKEGDITNRRLLNSLELPEFHNVMILSYSEKMPIQEADATTLVTLMHLRDIKRQKRAQFSIVSEMMDIKNRTLAEIARPDDYIISDHIISLIISQLAENKELKLVFDELFDSHGCEFYLKPVEVYLHPGEEVNFYTVIEAALRRNEIAIGYRLQKYARESSRGHGVIINPNKTEKIVFNREDKIIVLAEDL